jgi:hypothetical protein
VDIFNLGIMSYQLSHNSKHSFNNDHIQRIIIYSKKYDEDDFKLNPKTRLTWEKYFSHPLK